MIPPRFNASSLLIRDAAVGPVCSPGLAIRIGRDSTALSMREVADLRDALNEWLAERGRP